MSFSLLIALFLAFGFDTPTTPGRLPRAEVVPRVLEVLGGLAVVGVVAFGLGRLVAIRVAHQGRVTPAIRRFHAFNRRVVTILTLAFYGWVIYEVGWPRVVRSGLGLGDMVLVDEALILLPFLLAQGLVLWGFFAAERALRPLEAAVQPIGLRRYLVLRARQSMGLVLPVAAVFSLGQDLFRWQWPQAAEGAWAQPIGLAAMGALVLVLSPAFVRLAWPTRPLPPGPLRDRLERVADRFGFRCTDILVWDTGGALINAGVTGALPWFRYVLLTDALIEDLDRTRSPRSSATRSATSRIGTCSISASSRWGASASWRWPAGRSTRRWGRGWGSSPGGGLLGDRDRAGGRVRDLPGPVFPAGLRPRLAPVRAAGRRLRVPRRLVRPGRLPPARRLGRRGRRGARRTGAALPRGDPDVRGRPGQRRHAQRDGAPQAVLAARQHPAADRVPGGLVGQPESERRFQLGVSRLRVALALVLIVSVALAVASGSIEHLR